MSTETPKRDKFAAMSARSGDNEPQRKRDKFAAIASRGEDSSKRDKLSAMAAHREETMTTVKAETDECKAVKETQATEWKTRIEEQNQVWSDMDKAEASTIHLLKVAQQTAEALAQNEMTQLHELSQKYRDTLQTIHDALAPHAALIRAYTLPSRINRMYQARVELQMAEQRRDLFRELLRIEKNDENHDSSLKRKRDE